MTAETSNAGGEVVAWLRVRPDGTPDWAEDCIADDDRFLDPSLEQMGYRLRPLTYADATPPPAAARGDVRGLRRPSDAAIAAAFWEHRARENSIPPELCDAKLVQFGHKIVSRARVLEPSLAAEGVQAGEVEQRAPSYEALLLIAQSVCAALERAGITDCDDPGEAIDVLRERYEAQAQGGGEVIQRHVVTKYRDGSVHVADVAAPPSAPVGVEGLAAKWRGLANDALRRSGTWNGNDIADRIEFMADELEALAQQPAAVDGAMVRRALCAWFDDPSGEGLERGNHTVELWFARMEAALTAAISAQPGGSDNDR